MSELTKKAYSPAMRLKAGEIEGVRQLAADVADLILPRFILPPIRERDKHAPLLSDMNQVPEISQSLAAAWRRRPALIDPTFILDEFGRDRANDWLPQMFDRARKNEVHAIPLAYFDAIDDCLDAFRESIDRNAYTKFGILVPTDAIDPMIEGDFAALLAKRLSLLGITPSDCVVIIDFAGFEIGDPSSVAPIISGQLETLQVLGLWQHIVFQGSYYPEKNPAPDTGGSTTWPRNEWAAWCEAVQFDPTTAHHLIFGDYVADCSTIEFRASSAKAIPHLRYTTGKNWRVQRGVKSGSQHASMHSVFASIAESDDFAGPSFSAADAFIARAAADATAPHGNATTWRQLNTTHHVTQVVRDIAQVRGTTIKLAPINEELQMSLLP